MKKSSRILFWILGLLLLGLLFHKVGVGKVWAHLRLVGWGFIPVIGVSLLWNLSNTWAWAACFDPGARPGFWSLLRTKLCGDAVGNVTPVSHVGGEVAKAYMLREQVGVTRGLPSLVVNKTIEIVSGLGFALLGTVVAFQQFSLPGEVQIGLAAALLAGSLGIGVAVLKQRKNTFGWVLNLLARLRLPFLEGKREKVEEMDRNIAAFYGQNRKGFLVSLVLHTFSWSLSVVEIYVILQMLDEPLSLLSAFLLSSLSVVINTAFFFVPSGIGVFEGSHVFLFHLLGLNVGLGLAVGIIRRIRKLFWVGVGFLLLLLKAPPFRRSAGASETAAERIPEP